MMMRFIFLYTAFMTTALSCFGQIGLFNSDTLYIDNGTIMFVEGDFVNEHVDFENNGEFTLRGDLENSVDISEEGGGTFRLQGPQMQLLNLLGEFKTFNLDIDNDADVLFTGNRNLSVFGDLDFIDGIFFTNDNNLITFKSEAIYFDASDFSHIDGPAIKEGNSAFRFPIGKLNRLRPMAISETFGFNSFQAEYFRETAPTLTKENGLTSVSDFEYWSLAKGFGIDDPKITLTWDELSFLNDAEDDLEIGYTPELFPWSLVEASTILPEQLENDLTSDNVIPGYGLFTFASTNNSTIMQDGVIDFELEKYECTVHVKWDSNERARRISSYSIERSENGFDFEEVYTIDARNTRGLEDYLFVDRDLEEHKIYHYRIVGIYFEGSDVISDSKFILASCYPISLTLYPNPAYTDDILTLEVFSEIEKDLEIRVVDVLGRVLQTRVLELKPGNSKYLIGDTQHYGAAEYFIWTPEIEEIPTLKFQIIR